MSIYWGDLQFIVRTLRSVGIAFICRRHRVSAVYIPWPWRFVTIDLLKYPSTMLQMVVLIAFLARDRCDYCKPILYRRTHALFVWADDGRRRTQRFALVTCFVPFAALVVPQTLFALSRSWYTFKATDGYKKGTTQDVDRERWWLHFYVPLVEQSRRNVWFDASQLNHRQNTDVDDPMPRCWDVR